MSRTIRPRFARLAAAALLGTALAWSLSSVQAVPAATTAPAHPSQAAVSLAAPAATGASDVSNLGTSFQWSDEPPLAMQESVTLTAFSQEDFTDPVISSAEYNSSPTLGVSGEKEGPYDWVPPNYWYDTAHMDTRDSTQTNAGGSWGYDSEQSAGDTIPTMDSLNRFMSASDLSNLWQNSTFNQYHANYEPTCNTNYNFGTLCHFDAALDARYGTPSSVAKYVEEAQAQNYENTRAQYEAFIDHAGNTPLPSTGTISGSTRCAR